MRRGDVIRLRPRGRSGHEQQGARYAVIVQSDALMRLSTVIVAPTSTVVRPAGSRPLISVDGISTRVLVEQMVTIDASFATDVVDHLGLEDLWAVEDAMSFVLGLA
jgi:mRNA interferase MazF